MVRLVLCLLLVLSSVVRADNLTYQVVEKEFSLTPNLVKSVEKSTMNPNGFFIILTDEGFKKANEFFKNTYDKKLNILFKNKIVGLSISIKLHEFPHQFYLSVADETTREELFNYLSKK